MEGIRRAEEFQMWNFYYTTLDGERRFKVTAQTALALGESEVVKVYESVMEELSDHLDDELRPMLPGEIADYETDSRGVVH